MNVIRTQPDWTRSAMKYLILVLLLFSAPVHGQAIPSVDALPDRPVPRLNLLIRPVNGKTGPRGSFLVRPFHDKPVLFLAAISAGAVTWDNVTTRVSENRGNFEINPLMRPFAHNSASLALEGAGTVWISAFVADRMKHSRNVVLRKTWWLPQFANISLPLYGGIRNTVMLSR